jgi:IS5 family transposase
MQQTDLGLNLSTKRTRKREFLAQVDRVIPWGDMVAVVSPTPVRARQAVRRLRC